MNPALLLIEHPPQAMTSPGRGMELGRLDDAIAEYRRFLELWKDADRDLPEIRSAR